MFNKCWHLLSVTVKGHTVRLVTSGNAGVFKMLMFCIQTLALSECWHLWPVTVKGHSGPLVRLGNFGVLYTNSRFFKCWHLSRDLAVDL